MEKVLKDENYNNLPEIINKDSAYYNSTIRFDKQKPYNLQLGVEKVPTIKAEEKWTKEFSQQEINWSQFYQMSFSCTVDFKLRNFKYKYLKRKILNNKYLLN